MMKQRFYVYELFYIALAAGYMLTLASDMMRPGVFGAVLMVLVLAELILNRSIRISGLGDILAVAFFAYQIISVIWLLRGGFPLSVFADEFVSSAFPMIFYFAGKSAGKRTGKFYRNYLIAMMMLGVSGVLLFITAPQFYLDWAYRWSYISKADAATMHVRMHSVVGSTCLSFLMVAGICAGSYFLTSCEDGASPKKDKDDPETDSGSSQTDSDSSQKNSDGSLKENDRPQKAEPDAKQKRKMIIAGVLTMAACLLFSIMANQRSGLVAAFIVLVYINYLLVFHLNLIPKKFFWIEICAVSGVFVLVAAVRFDFILKFWYRIISLPTAISQRSEQWVAAVNNMYSSWTGNGLGANGHRALGIEDAHVIADGGLVKLYCENGVLGFSIWLYLMIISLSDGIKNIRGRYAEIGIIAAGLLQSIGSNMLAFMICAPVFWFAAGRCNAKNE